MAEEINNNAASEQQEQQGAKFPEFIQKRLDLIDWDSFKDVYGVDKKYFLGNERLGTQLANGQVTDFVPCNLKTVDGARVLGNLALQATFYSDGTYKIANYTPSQEPDLTLYGQQLYSKAATESLLKTFKRPIFKYDEDGKVVKDAKGESEVLGWNQVHEYANAGRPIVLKRKDKDGNEVETKYLVSLDHVCRGRDGKAYRGTNRLFLVPCENVKSYLTKVAPKLYGHEFTEAQVEALSEGKDLLIKDFQTRDGKTFEAVVQFDAVQRKVVSIEPEYWRLTQKAAATAEKTETKAKKAAGKKTAEKKEEKAEKAAPARTRRG